MFDIRLSGVVASQYETRDGKHAFIKIRPDSAPPNKRNEETVQAVEVEVPTNVKLDGISLRTHVEITGYGYCCTVPWVAPNGAKKDIDNTRLVARVIKALAS